MYLVHLRFIKSIDLGLMLPVHNKPQNMPSIKRWISEGVYVVYLLKTYLT
jgi:hypothetical protein